MGKYGEDRGGWCSWEVWEEYGVGLWKAIRKLGHLVNTRLSFVVGNGQRVSFWNDKWCGTSSFCESYPFLFVFSATKEAKVSDMRTVLASGEKGGGRELEPLFH